VVDQLPPAAVALVVAPSAPPSKRAAAEADRSAVAQATTDESSVWQPDPSSALAEPGSGTISPAAFGLSQIIPDGNAADASTDAAPAAIHLDAAAVTDAATIAALTTAPAGPSFAQTLATAAPIVLAAPPVAAEDTHAALAVRISTAVQDGHQTLSIELHPADLGRVEVRLSFHPDGVGVQMTVDKKETFDAFTRDRASLEQQFSQAGIDLGGGGLNLRFGSQTGQPADRDPATGGGRYTALSQPAAVAAATAPMRTAQGSINILA
jgi:flagellar hook-length control protein FliK